MATPDPLAAGYVRTVLDHPAMAEWTAAALRESEAHPHYDRLADAYGGQR